MGEATGRGSSLHSVALHVHLHQHLKVVLTTTCLTESMHVVRGQGKQEWTPKESGDKARSTGHLFAFFLTAFESLDSRFIGSMHP